MGRRKPRRMSYAHPVRPFFQDEEASPTIALSWKRCSDRGLDPAQAPDLTPDSHPPRHMSPAVARYLAIVRPAMEDVYQFIEGSQSAIAFTDSDGRLHDLIGDPEGNVLPHSSIFPSRRRGITSFMT